MAIATMAASVNDTDASSDHSWQDVYMSYGCSVDGDVSDDDG